jgi:hypothetical protein
MTEYAGSNFLKVDTMKRRGTMVAQIAAVNKGKFDKPNIVFDTGEILSANKTVVGELIRLFGDESDDWIDNDIELYVGPVTYNGTTTDVILVRAVGEAPAPAPTTKPNSDVNTTAAERRASALKGERKNTFNRNDMDDDIPSDGGKSVKGRR